MEFRKLVKNSSYLASTKFIQFIVGIFRSKINAIILGTQGVGVISQFLMLFKSASSFTTLGMNEAVVKQIAQNFNSEKSKALIESSIKTYIITVSVFILGSTSLLYLFRFEVTTYVFGKTDYLNLFYLALCTFPILIVNSIFFSILKGFKAIKHIARSRLGFIVSNFLIFLPLVLIYKLKGAIVYIPLSYIVTLIWNFYFANKYYLKPNKISFHSIRNSQMNIAFRTEMLNFSFYGLIVGVMGIVSVFIGRAIVIEDIGIDAIGLYSPIMAWAGLFTGFLLPSFNTYLFPRFSEVKSNKEASGIINDAIRLSTFGLLPLILLAIPFRFILIELFYSKEFTGAALYLPGHFIGVAFNVWFVVLSQSMTPRGFIKQHSIFKLIFYVLHIVLAYVLIPQYGLYGWMSKSIIGNLFLFGSYYLFLKFKTKLNLSKSNLRLMAYLILGSLSLIVMDELDFIKNINMLLGPILLLGSFFFLSKKEKNFVIDRIKITVKK